MVPASTKELVSGASRVAPVTRSHDLDHRVEAAEEPSSVVKWGSADAGTGTGRRPGSARRERLDYGGAEAVVERGGRLAAQRRRVDTVRRGGSGRRAVTRSPRSAPRASFGLACDLRIRDADVADRPAARQRREQR
jgi:hypothetical protein